VEMRGEPMKDTFEGYHPATTFLYFGMMFAGTLAFAHPLAQGISLVCALVYAIRQEREAATCFALKFCLPMLLLTAIINPAFSHAGVTILAYLPTGNPLTLESILYGLSAGTMLACALLWFRSFNRVITSDKFVYLFGRIAPVLSLVLSMTLRFVPRFKTQLSAVARGQRSIGRDVSRGSVWSRTKTAITIFSVTVTWALENAIETADSMKGRGYGLKGRTAFSIYRFDARDRNMLCWLGFCGLFLLGGGIAHGFAFRYFPSLFGAALTPVSCTFYLVYFALCITPVAINIREERTWNSIHSKM